MKRSEPRRAKQSVSAIGTIRAEAEATGTRPDIDALQSAIREAVKTLMAEQIDELIRHHRAMAAILDQHKDAAVEKMTDEVTTMLKRHRHRRGADHGPRSTGGQERPIDPGQEGAVF